MILSLVRTLISAFKARRELALEQEFNSLDAQREACAAYIASHKAEGWVLLPTVYEDAGSSGGTLERSGLQRLLADIDAGLVEQIVVYKVDRLARSLSDFAKLVERLEQLCIRHRAGRRGTLQPRIVTAGGDVQQSAHRGNR